jgi:hypothetical protein
MTVTAVTDVSFTDILPSNEDEHVGNNERTSKLPVLNWTRLNYKGEDHDNRRLLQHRAIDCTCDVCFLELHKLPPAEPLREKYARKKKKLEEREIRKVKRIAKKEVKSGKQACIRNFFRY